MTRPEEEDEAGTDTAGGGGDREPFDAVGAAEELEASLAEPGARGGDSGPYVEMLEGEIDALGAELAEVRAAAERASERAAAAAEDSERAKERVAREAERETERRLRKVLASFLEVLDDLDRAIGSAREMDHNPDVLAGVELVRKRFLETLAAYGVRHVPARGEPFDPNLHDAVSAVPVTDPAQDGIVVGVVSEGYALGDETLRPARVAVGKIA